MNYTPKKFSALREFTLSLTTCVLSQFSFICNFLNALKPHNCCFPSVTFWCTMALRVCQTHCSMDTNKVPVMSHISLVLPWPAYTWPQPPRQELLGACNPSIRLCLQHIRGAHSAIRVTPLHSTGPTPTLPSLSSENCGNSDWNPVSHTVRRKTFLSASTCRHLFPDVSP